MVFWVFIRHNNTPLVKASGRELCYILLLGVFMSYAMTFLFLAKPSPTICALRRLGLGTSFAVCYSALLTKTNRIARIFSGVKDGGGATRPRFISPFSQVSQPGRKVVNRRRHGRTESHSQYCLFQISPDLFRSLAARYCATLPEHKSLAETVNRSETEDKTLLASQRCHSQ